MKFNKHYPNAKYADQHKYKDSFIVKTNALRCCTICKELTWWIDGGFHSYVCCFECIDKLNEAYFQEMQQVCKEIVDLEGEENEIKFN